MDRDRLLLVLGRDSIDFFLLPLLFLIGVKNFLEPMKMREGEGTTFFWQPAFAWALNMLDNFVC